MVPIELAQCSPLVTSLEVYGNIDEELSENGNIDVRVQLADGRSFVPTFFTIKNLASLLGRYKSTGECAHGTYLWASDMIIVERITEDVIRTSIMDLIETGDIENVCKTIAEL
jgi:hypothetical protein